MASFLDRLDAAFAARGFAPYKVEKESGLGVGYIANLRKRKGGLSTASAEALAAALHVSSSWLAFGEGPSGLEADQTQQQSQKVAHRAR